jgi:hypothetical protein
VVDDIAECLRHRECDIGTLGFRRAGVGGSRHHGAAKAADCGGDGGRIALPGFEFFGH